MPVPRRALLLLPALTLIAVCVGWLQRPSPLSAAELAAEAAAIPTLSVETATPGTLVLLAAGDTDLAQSAMPKLREHGPDWALDLLRPQLQADVRMLNLETVLIRRATEPPLDKTILHHMRPAYLAALKHAGFQIMGLANNHAMDQGARGLAATLRHLDRHGIMGIGAGASLSDARRGMIIDTGSLRLGLLSVMPYRKDLDALGFFATDTTPGIAAYNPRQTAADIARLRRHADRVMVTVHWGVNYKPVRRQQRRIAQQLVDAGADLISGHGAHMAQSVETLQGVPVLYSLGNFVFGPWGRYQALSPDLRTSLLARYRFVGHKLDAVEVLPLLTDNHQIDFQPRASPPERAESELRPVLKALGAHWSRGPDGWYRLR